MFDGLLSSMREVGNGIMKAIHDRDMVDYPTNPKQESKREKFISLSLGRMEDLGDKIQDIKDANSSEDMWGDY